MVVNTRTYRKMRQKGQKMSKQKPEQVAMPTNPNVMRFYVHIPNEKSLRVETIRTFVDDTYGNQTYVSVYVGNNRYKYFDTRYCKSCSSVEGYQKMFEDWVRENWEHDGQVVERIA